MTLKMQSWLKHYGVDIKPLDDAALFRNGNINVTRLWRLTVRRCRQLFEERPELIPDE